MPASRHGVWLFKSARPLSDSRIWREDENGSSLPTSFSRALGVRTGDAGALCFSGMFGELPRACSSLSALLNGLYGRSLDGVEPLIPPDALARRLRAASGYAVVAAPGLKLRSVPGLAALVAIARVKPEDEP